MRIRIQTGGWGPHAAFAAVATAHGFILSMSRPANPYDNALAERFVATLKAECFD